jgi:hypothetical protein
MSYKNVEVFERALFLWNNAWSAILVHSDVCQDCIGHPAAYFINSVAKTPLCIDGNVHRYGSPAYLDDLGIKTHDIPDKYRLLEYEGIHGYGGNTPASPAYCWKAPRDVHLRHDPAAEYIPGIISVRWHRHQAQYRIEPLGQ